MADLFEDGARLTFPVKGGGEWHLTPAILAELQALYPELDVLEECRHALAWVLAHPDRRKARMRAFLSGWLTRTSRERKFGGGGGQVRARASLAAVPMKGWGWVCRHVEAHHSRWACEMATQLGKPERAEYE